YAEQYRDLETQNTNLANLYVASYQLHGTLEPEQVLVRVQEIVTNLVGCEELAIFERAPDSTTFSLAAATGLSAQRHRQVRSGVGVIGSCLATGEIFIKGSGPEPTSRLEEETDLTACVPLKLGDEVSGAIA